MRVLVTRPSEDAEPLAERLAAAGIDSQIEPLLTIENKEGAAPDLDGVQALLATSANGVRALAAAGDRRDVPLFAVGDATARAARDAGFVHVESAAGDVAQLADLVVRLCGPAGGALLHAAGSKVAGDLGKTLKAAGFTYRRAVLYSARAATRLSDDALAALRGDAIDAVLFFSPRTAETFVSLVRKARVARACRRLTAVCLSQAVADAAGTLSWGRVAVASRPDQEALVALIAEPNKSPWGDMPKRPKKSPKSGESQAAAPDAGVAAEAAAEIAAEPAGTPAEPTAQMEGAGGKKAEDDKAAKSATDGRMAAGATAEASADAGDATMPRPLSRRSVIPAVILWTLVLFAVIGGVVYAAWPFWAPYVDSYVRAVQADPLSAVSARLTALEDRAKANQKAGDALAELEKQRAEISSKVAALVQRVDGLEKSLDSVRDIVKATNLPHEAEDARKALDQLSARIAELEKGDSVSGIKQDIQQLDTENAKISAKVAAIAAQVQGIEKKGPAVDAATRSTIVAADTLREALRSAAPFTKELDAVRAISAGRPEVTEIVDKLTPLAAKGIPTLATLSDRFPKVAHDVSVAARSLQGDSWVAEVLNRVSSLVSIRRTDANAKTDPVDAAIAHAEAALADGDLIAAVAAVEGLDGAPAKAAAAWLAEARGRVLAERAMAVLHVLSVSLMTPSSP